MRTTSVQQIKLLLGFLLAACLLWLPVSGYGQASPDVEVRVAQTTLQVAAGSTTDVAVEVVDVGELYATDLTLTFDPDAIQVEDANPGLGGVQVSLGIFLDPGFVLINDVDNENGIIRFAMTQLSPSKAKSGTGHLVVFEVRGEEAGSSSQLSLDDVKLARGNGTAIEATPSSGQVDVTDSPAEGASQTPLPRQSPGTPMPTLTATMTPVATTPVPPPTPTRTPFSTTPASAATATPAPTKATEPALSPTVGAPQPEMETTTPGAASHDHDATPQTDGSAPEIAETAPTAIGDAGASPEPLQETTEQNSEVQTTSTVAGTPATVQAQEQQTDQVTMPSGNSDSEDSSTQQEENKLNPAWLLLLAGALAMGLALLLAMVAVVILIATRRKPSN